MKIVLLVEGRTEKAFLPILRAYIDGRLATGIDRPKLSVNRYDGRIPKQERLRKIVANEVRSGAHAVIALTDVVTGSNDFKNAFDAKGKMTAWCNQHPNFYPHAAPHDFETWLLPYWDEIRTFSGSTRAAPAISPESVNHNRPPAHLLAEVFLHGSKGRAYSKPRDAARILDNQDLTVAANACTELKSFLNRILALCGGTPIP